MNTAEELSKNVQDSPTKKTEPKPVELHISLKRSKLPLSARALAVRRRWQTTRARSGAGGRGAVQCGAARSTFF